MTQPDPQPARPLGPPSALWLAAQKPEHQGPSKADIAAACEQLTRELSSPEMAAAMAAGEDELERLRRLPTTEPSVHYDDAGRLRSPAEASAAAARLAEHAPVEGPWAFLGRMTHDEAWAHAIARAKARDEASRPDCPSCGRPRCPRVCPACGTERLS